MKTRPREEIDAREVALALDGIVLHGDLTVPRDAIGLVLFAHGSGSSRFSPRNRAVASALHEGKIATLLLDLLTAEEERVDSVTGMHRFDIGLLADRLVAATDWAESRAELRGHYCRKRPVHSLSAIQHSVGRQRSPSALCSMWRCFTGYCSCHAEL